MRVTYLAKSRTLQRLARAISITAVAMAARAASAAEYGVIDLGALTNTATGHSNSIDGVNASGQVSLTNAPGGTAYHAYRYSAGMPADLGTLGGTSSFAGGINTAGQVVGRSPTAGGVTHPFLWTPGGTDGVASNPQMKDLTPAGGNGVATAINNNGQIVGYVTVSHPGQSNQDRAYIYSGNTLTQIPLPTGGYFYSYAYGINDKGKVVGEAYTASSPQAYGFVYNGSSTLGIGNLGGGSGTPLAINNNDVVTGYSTGVDGFDHAFTYSNGTMSDLGTLGGHYSYGNAINNKNVIVGGSFIDDADSIYHAFSSDGVTMTDLNTRVTSKAADWVLAEATGINDNGVIVGTGTLLGHKHGFMLRPLTPGDANADGTVDFADLVTVAQNYGGSGADWEHGDFTDDGNVNFADLVAIAQNYGTAQTGFTPQFAADLQAAFAEVPEPGAALTGVWAGLLLTRRRRRVAVG